MFISETQTLGEGGLPRASPVLLLSQISQPCYGALNEMLFPR